MNSQKPSGPPDVSEDTAASPESAVTNGPSDSSESSDVDEPTLAPSKLEAELVEAQRQRDEYLDLCQRSRAEFINYQKRVGAKAEAERQYAAAPLASDLLPVLDNLERALDAARKSENQTMVEGLELVLRQFLAALAKHGVEPIRALHQPFDPNWHEAVSQMPGPGHAEGTVIAELSRGYRLRDRLLRPTSVIVAVKPS